MSGFSLYRFQPLNARTSGSLRTAEDYLAVCRQIADRLGTERMRKMHIHFSKIEYGSSGEIRHLTFEDHLYGPSFEDFAPVIHQLNLEPVIICESAGTQDIDALTMKKLVCEQKEK